MSLESKLFQLGLNQKQAKVYLAALELGKASITEIAKKAEKVIRIYCSIPTIIKGE